MVAEIGDIVTYIGNLNNVKSKIIRRIMKEYFVKGYQYEILGVGKDSYRIDPYNIKTVYDSGFWVPKNSFKTGRPKEFYKVKYNLR